MKQKILLNLLYFIFPLVSLCFSDFPDPKLIDKEFEMDVFMEYFLPEWNFQYLFSENGLRITAGSLNIKHLNLNEELKLRTLLINNKLWARFYHKRIETIDNKDFLNEIEFEYSPLNDLYLSFLGTPEFKKYEIDIGWAVRYAKDEGNGLKLSYILTDFDNNYAFHNDSTVLGFKKFYKNVPKKWRLEIKRDINVLKSYVFVEYNTKTVYDYEDLTDVTQNYDVENKNYRIDTNINTKIYSDWKLGFDLNLRKNNDKKDFVSISSSLNENFSSVEKKYILRPYFEKSILENLTIFSGFSFIKHIYDITYPNNIINSYNYDKDNMGGFTLFYLNLPQKSLIEFGYLHDNIDWDKNGVNGNSKENRLKFGYEYKFNEKSSIKFITGWDLDRQDWGKFAFFDGGHVQFQAIF
ncbi:MAG: hypothetical protein A2539_01705 [Elusimicrobia bacterium RIFOXYD2_FULL_34_15]|nr:MAG: hypothetical protein A2539_01705 [Elusimicrobia bacterium RIFOXYD2_FULL_34_15]